MRTIVLLFIGCLVGCAARQAPVLDVAATRSTDFAVVWNSYWDYLELVLDHKRRLSDDFDRSVAFFEQVTGIESKLPGTVYGRILNRTTLKQAMSHWDSWYRKHGDGYEWNPDQGPLSIEVPWLREGT